MAAPEYVGFDLTIDGSWDAGFVVHADIDGYRPSEELDLPDAWDAAALGKWLAYFKEAAEGIKRGGEEADLETRGETFGRALFDAVITGKIAVRYGILRNDDTPVRVRLNVAAAELHGVPWEYLCDSETGIRLATHEHTPVVRTFGATATPRRPAAPEILRVLLMEATGGEALDGDTEIDSIEQTLAARDDIAITRVEPTIDALEAELERGEYHVFHFIGHGEYSDRGGRGELLLGTTDDGTEVRVSATTLANTLAPHGTLRLVVLNACEGARSSERDPQSGIAQKLFKGGIDAVVAMQYQIVDDNAVDFSTALYGQIAARSPIDLAVSSARKSIQRTTDWATPVLFMRTGDGVLFDEAVATPADDTAETTGVVAESTPPADDVVDVAAAPQAEPEPELERQPVGTPEPARSTREPPPSPEPAAPEPASPATDDGRARRGPVLVGIVVLLALVGGIVFAATRSGDDGTDVDAAAVAEAEADNETDATSTTTTSTTTTTAGAGDDGGSTAGVDAEEQGELGSGPIDFDGLVSAEAQRLGLPDDWVFWLDLDEGDCVDWGPVQAAEVEPGQWNVLVSCDGARSAEVIGIDFVYPDVDDEPTDWPGIDTLFFQAKPICDAMYAAVYGSGRENDIFPQTPSQEEWEGALRLRETTCFLQGAPAGEPASS